MIKKIKICALLIVVLFSIQGCSELNKNDENSIQIFAMDTYMKVTTYGEKSEEAANAVAAEIRRLEQMLSTGNENSQVSEINKSSGGEMSEEIAYLVEKSLDLNLQTQGDFDITIYPVMRAWGFTDGNFRIPEKDELNTLLQKVDAKKIVVENNNLKLPEDVQIDFGGIAKGYTGQRAIEILKEYDIESALLNLGGNVVCYGNKINGEPWNIGIEDPEKNGNYLGAVKVANKSVVTSGGYERFFEEGGVRYHHIIDPETGYPAYNGLVSVTIISEDGTLADGLSTALFVMGTEKAIEFWKNNSKEFECILYTEDGKLFVSSGVANAFSSNLKYEVISSNK